VGSNASRGLLSTKLRGCWRACLLRCQRFPSPVDAIDGSPSLTLGAWVGAGAVVLIGWAELKLRAR
jgi:hypothetical protein